MHFLLSKRTPIDRKLIEAKLSEAEIRYEKGAIMRNIDQLEKSWRDLVPLAQHPLEEYGYVSRDVKSKFGRDDYW